MVRHVGESSRAGARDGGTQETVPIWILNNLRLPNQRPIVNVVAVFLVLLSLLPLYLAQRLTRDGSTAGGRA